MLILWDDVLYNCDRQTLAKGGEKDGDKGASNCVRCCSIDHRSVVLGDREDGIGINECCEKMGRSGYAEYPSVCNSYLVHDPTSLDCR